ncbi:MAG: sigma 54-interacting transcriptional regulator [Planctomycetota bacterium]|nr:sigma 54-interacting transcriptional regulator [Planctomycetota bacterium]
MPFELKITSGGSTWTVPLEKGPRWRIGRANACEVRVTDPFVSAEHLELVLSGDAQTLLMRRTGGSNPVMIEGRAVESTWLSAGARFSIGDTEFTVLATSPAAPAAEPPVDSTHVIETRAVLQAGPVPAPPVPPPAADDTRAGDQCQEPQRVLPSQLMAEVFNLLRQATDKQALAGEILNLACQQLGATRALLARVEGPQRLDILAVKGFPPNATVASLISKTVLQRILDQRQAVIIGDTAVVKGGVGPGSSIVKNSIRAVACTPIQDRRGNLSGLLYVDNQSRQAEFTAHDAEFLIWLGQVYDLLAEDLEMRRRLEAEVVTLKRAAGEARIIAEAPAMVQLLERAHKAAASEAAVLILGESGAGKECIARFVHQQSPRAGKPFKAVNCGAVPESLFESEMFGHKKGAFTGAAGDRLGLFREADGGTLFLDEIGDLGFDMQKKLLRAIEEGVVRPVGGDKDVPVNVRLICATNKDLGDAIRTKAFREDLYYRIAAATLKVPPLRDRREDIAPLARHFARQFSDGARTLSAAAEGRLLAYEWPGNVRELRSVVQQAVIGAGGTEIQADDLDLPGSGAGMIMLGPQSLAEVERRHILQVLKDVGGNKTEAAQVLGLARSTLVLKLKSYSRETK